MANPSVAPVALLLALSLCFGLAAAPAVAAACPPVGGPGCGVLPIAEALNCTAAEAGSLVAQVLTDCI